MWRGYKNAALFEFVIFWDFFSRCVHVCRRPCTFSGRRTVADGRGWSPSGLTGVLIKRVRKVSCVVLLVSPNRYNLVPVTRDLNLGSGGEPTDEKWREVKRSRKREDEPWALGWRRHREGNRGGVSTTSRGGAVRSRGRCVGSGTCTPTRAPRCRPVSVFARNVVYTILGTGQSAVDGRNTAGTDRSVETGAQLLTDRHMETPRTSSPGWSSFVGEGRKATDRVTETPSMHTKANKQPETHWAVMGPDRSTRILDETVNTAETHKKKHNWNSPVRTGRSVEETELGWNRRSVPGIRTLWIPGWSLCDRRGEVPERNLDWSQSGRTPYWTRETEAWMPLRIYLNLTTDTSVARLDSDTGRTAATVADVWGAPGGGSGRPTAGHTMGRVAERPGTVSRAVKGHQTPALFRLS